MSSDYWESWLMGGDAYGRQTRAELAQARADESRARNRLESQMRTQQGNLQGQIDQLTTAFIAFVEYEDVRGELNEHADAAACRKYAREVVPNLVVTGGSGLGALVAPPEVSNYWLSWAMRGLVSAATGAGGADQLAEAQRLDPRRTSLLLVLLDAIRREPRWSTGHLEATLPRSSSISNAERLVWLAVADGRLGESAVAALEAGLVRALGIPDQAAVDTWVRGLVPLDRSELPSVRAATTLTELERRVVPSYAENTTASPAAGGAEDPLAEQIRALVDEGAPGEAEIIARMTEVRGRMGFLAAASTDDHWDADAGTLLDLLLTDLSPLESSPGRRRLAARLLAPALPPVVEALRQEAAAEPGDTVVHASGLPVTITAAGPTDPTWRARLEEKVRSETGPEPTMRIAAYAALVVGVVGLGLALISAGWLALAIIGLGAGAWLLWSDRSERARIATENERRINRAVLDVESGAQKQSEQRSHAASAAAAADATATRLTQALSPEPVSQAALG